jgi:bifunctional non-homologous end joining protein LigD
VFDLDPAPDVGFEVVIDSAREIRDRLEDLGLVSFCKTTGGKGLHVVTLLDAKGIDWSIAKAFARDVCKAMAADAPDRYVITMARRSGTGASSSTSSATTAWPRLPRRSRRAAVQAPRSLCR